MFKQFYGVEVQNAVSGAGIKERIPVAGVALINYNLSLNLVGQTIGGVLITAGTRFLFAAQTNQVENGIYIIDVITVRAPDLNTGMNATNIFVFSQSDNTNWQVVNNCTVGTSNMMFKMVSNLNYNSGDIFYCGQKTIEKLNAPVTNSVLSINSTGVPSWAQQLVLLSADPILVNNTTYAAVAYFTYITAVHGANNNSRIIFEVAGTGSINIRISAGAVIYTSALLTAGVYQLNFTGPGVNSRMIFETKKNPGSNATIYGLSYYI